jgi:hypothetical protein
MVRRASGKSRDAASRRPTLATAAARWLTIAALADLFGGDAGVPADSDLDLRED